MKANELRIGNFVLVNGQVIKIENLEIVAGKEIVDPVDPEPIPLTEEWLKRFEFEKINHIHGYSFYSLSRSKNNKCHIDIYDTYTRYMSYSVNHCTYVHQLQNLFFSITGEELKIQ